MNGFLVITTCVLIYYSVRMIVLTNRIDNLYDAVQKYIYSIGLNNLTWEEVEEILCSVKEYPSPLAILCFWDKGYKYMLKKGMYEKIEEFLQRSEKNGKTYKKRVWNDYI